MLRRLICKSVSNHITTAMQKEERAFVECQLNVLIQRAAKKLAERKKWSKWAVDERDVKEFLERETRIEPASEGEEDVKHLVHEFHGTNKQSKLAEEKKQNERNEDFEDFEILSKPSANEIRVEAKSEFTGSEHSPGKTAKLTYEARVVDNQSFKMLAARIDKDSTFRVYQLNSSFLGQNPIKTGAIGGAVAGAVVGGAIGVVMAVTLTATGGAGGAAVGYGVGKLMSMPKSEEVMTAHDIFCFSKEDKDMGKWREEGRYVICKFKYMYQRLEEVMALEEYD